MKHKEWIPLVIAFLIKMTFVLENVIRCNKELKV